MSEVAYRSGGPQDRPDGQSEERNSQDQGASYSNVMAYTSQVLGLIEKEELSKEDSEWIKFETVNGYKEHVNPGYLFSRKTVDMNKELAFVEWKDARNSFIDIDGNEYIDCIGGRGIYNVGHRHPKVLQTVMNQLQKQAMHTHDLLDPYRAILAKTLAEITPGDLKYVFFTNSGGEAVESAIKLARKATNRHTFISTTAGYHGVSLGSLAATGKAFYRKPFLPFAQNFRHALFGDVDMLYKLLKSLEIVGEEAAGVIIEPIQGNAGVRMPPDNYLQEVRQLCDEFGALLILDEVQTGMGRTGKMFYAEHENVTPDILCLAKALGGGIMPMGAIVASEKVYESFMEEPYRHEHTFGGNTLACVAAIATIHVLIEERLPERAAVIGEYMLKELRAIAARYPKLVQEIRGKGLFIGVEFFDSVVGFEVSKGLFDNKILVEGTVGDVKTFRIEPPLTIEQEQVDRVIQTFDLVLSQVQRKYNFIK
ncbi:aminotransferase class-III [Paenibacillus curdlanolyticus YK9]|uniref:Aminotransferase class-III n=1 Tax=Paenibacillus curdlanolyticus YK9 TaxID=717606 RepID=E0IG85_9BACL|nr:putrescine aminotransferase [Paenibacillus curdlanolyticus]EFM08487.1 aminotransferase class-III [Paenibacillus curdlanolyticus YK9]